MERIDVVSNAMELRGFGKQKKRTWYSRKPLKVADYLTIVFIVAFCVAAMVITFADGNRYFNPF
jgi:energy-coupling factor transport system permease protein